MSENIATGIGDVAGIEHISERIQDTNLSKGLFSRVLMGFVTIKIGFQLILVYLAFKTIKVLEASGSAAGIDAAISSLLMNLDGLFVLAGIAGLLICVLFFLWLYLSVSNRNEINPGTRRFSPTWACFGFVIPIVNAVMPILVMIDLWTGSIRQQIGKAKPKIVYGIAFSIIWWLFFLVEKGFNLMNTSLRTGEELASAELRIVVARVAIAAMAGVIHAVCFLQLIAWIERRQKEAGSDE